MTLPGCTLAYKLVLFMVWSASAQIANSLGVRAPRLV